MKLNPKVKYYLKFAKLVFDTLFPTFFSICFFHKFYYGDFNSFDIYVFFLIFGLYTVIVSFEFLGDFLEHKARGIQNGEDNL